MKKISFLAWILLMPLSLFSQYTLTGRIVSSENEPVLATVYIPELSLGTTCDFDGKYHLAGIPEGRHTVVFSALGFVTESVVFEFSDQEKVNFSLTMKASAVEMEEVIISTPFHKLQSENVMRVERLAAASMASLGAATLTDGITNISGVELISTGIGIGKPVIRGLSSNRVVTYTQGVRLENQQYGDEHGLGIHSSGIESVEVIKGPASMLYGSDAIGGVLYINPEKFALPGETSADLSSNYFSNTTGTTSSAGVKTSGEKIGFMVRAAHSSFADYKSGEGSYVTNSRFNENDLKTGLQFTDNSFRSSLRYNYNRANLGIPEEIGEQSRSKRLMLPFQKVDNHIVSSETRIFFNKSRLSFNLGYQFNDRKEFEEETATPELQMKLKTFSYDLKYHLPALKNLETIAGLQGMIQKNRNGAEEILIPDADITDLGVFLTSHYHLSRFDFQAGLRFDTRDIKSRENRISPELRKSYQSFTAALGTKYNPADRLAVRLNLATGYRAPNLAELLSDGVHEGTIRYERGNPDLKNEQNLQTDLSLEYRSDHFEFFINGFYNNLSDYIFLSPTDEILDGYPVYEYLQQDAYLAGGEAGIHLHPHPLDWLHLESGFETVTGKKKTGGYLPLIPANSLRTTLRIEFEDSPVRKNSFLFFSLRNVFRQNNPGDFETKSGGYALLSSGLETVIELEKLKLKIGINGTNLTNKRYIHHLSRFKPLGISDPGRSINFNIMMSI